ncbi:MAG: hypothetical protein JWR75_1759 [Devosia sp.]|nr:hypothetical protein [Devosia sp.]
MNPLSSERMTTDERLSALAEILALGVHRLRSAQSSALSLLGAESGVDCVGDRSGDVVRNRLESPDAHA